MIILRQLNLYNHLYIIISTNRLIKFPFLDFDFQMGHMLQNDYKWDRHDIFTEITKTCIIISLNEQ